MIYSAMFQAILITPVRKKNKDDFGEKIFNYRHKPNNSCNIRCILSLRWECQHVFDTCFICYFRFKLHFGR